LTNPTVKALTRGNRAADSTVASKLILIAGERTRRRGRIAVQAIVVTRSTQTPGADAIVAPQQKIIALTTIMQSLVACGDVHDMGRMAGEVLETARTIESDYARLTLLAPIVPLVAASGERILTVRLIGDMEASTQGSAPPPRQPVPLPCANTGRTEV
jgi:hypothetical protein